MKLAGREAARFFENPGSGFAALLIHGPDPARTAHRRGHVSATLIGPEGEAEMRLSRIAGGDLRRDSGLLLDAVKAQGFFPGPRVVVVEEATDALTATFEAALDDWRDGDAVIVASAGLLPARSRLRKLFETRRGVFCTAVYPDPPSRREVETRLSAAGLANIAPEALDSLVLLARDLEPGEFAQTAEKLALYTADEGGAVSTAAVAAVAPATTEAALDDAFNVIAEARAAEVGPLARRLLGQGLNPTAICIGAVRHFRALHMAATHPRGRAAGLSAVRPPVFGPRRDRMARQAERLGHRRIERALAILTDTDLELRSSSQAPSAALLERALIRIAMMARVQ